jgi:Brp/Blh family beta-carotene 15,15'-monooxygenase
MELDIVKQRIDMAYISASILFILLGMSFISFSFEFQIYLFLIGSLIIGLPHGALDYDVANYLGLCGTLQKKIIFFVGYLSIACAYFILWLYSPETAFVIFFLVSVWHFGEDWDENWIKDFFKIFRRCVFGLAFISLPALLHQSELETIFALFVPEDFGNIVAESLNILAIPLIATIIIFLGMDISKQTIIKNLRTLVFLGGAIFLTPILFLFLYFCVFHAPRHSAEIYYKLNYKNISVMIKNTIPILLFTGILLMIMFLFQSQLHTIDASIFSSLIIFIACLTMPHMILIEYFGLHYKDRKTIY